MCLYCRPLLNKDKMPSPCFVNGLESEPIPAELADFDSLSKKLIQRSKAFQKIVTWHLTEKLPKYYSLKACKGTMFFLPLPLEKTLETLGEVTHTGVAGSFDSPDGENTTNLPHPDQCGCLERGHSHLKENNLLYNEVDDDDLDDVAKEVIETVSDTSYDARKGFQRLPVFSP